MHVALDLIALVAVVTAVGGLARRWDLPAPLLLVLVGVGASFLPRYEGFELSPEVVLVGLLPPLLYAAAIRTSILDLRSNRRPILQLSVGLVIATTFAVGAVMWWLLPIPFPVALALGAVVAPPDAVAATAVARRVGLPRRLLTILEGESLVNDATALVCLRVSIAAMAGRVTAGEVAWEFVLSAVGGVLGGVVVAIVVGKIRKRIDDQLTDTAITFVTPFLAYLLAEEAHASGVLAVVVTGLLLGHKSSQLQSASSRVFERTNWATIQFLLESSVFLLIGLQVRSILDSVGASAVSNDRIALAAFACLATVVLVRPVWVFATTYAFRPRTVPWQFPAVVSWAGMRGVVTLAAAFVLPEDTPHREVLVLLAFVVTAGTLLVQGFTLPFLIRRLDLRGPDPAEDALTEAEVYQQAAAAGRARLAELEAAAQDGIDAPLAPTLVERLRRRSLDRADAAWERLGSSDETPSQAYARLRVEMLAAERDEVLRIRSAGTVPHEVLSRVLAALDVEESVLDLATDTWTAEADGDLRPLERAEARCEHLRDAPATAVPLTPEGCAGCLADGTTWVHLRLCLACGHVGCCDSSVGRHAERHHSTTGHPVMRSFEMGEAWRWCYPDELLG